jgi:hypothetical protein
MYAVSRHGAASSRAFAGWSLPGLQAFRGRTMDTAEVRRFFDVA